MQDRYLNCGPYIWLEYEHLALFLKSSELEKLTFSNILHVSRLLSIFAVAFREEFLRASVSILKTSAKRGSTFPKIFIGRVCFPNVSQFCHTRIEHTLTRIRACEQLQKFCEHEPASEHSSNFCEQFEVFKQARVQKFCEHFLIE